MSRTDVFENETWDPLAQMGYIRSSLILDAGQDRLVLYGGTNAIGEQVGDVWVKPLSGGAPWTKLDVPGLSPAGRFAHVAIYDPVRERMIVYGGACPGSCGAAWALSLSGTPSWTKLTAEGGGPGVRSVARAIYDPVGDRMILFGGYSLDAATLENEVWALSLSGTPGWTLLSPAGTPPSRRMEPAAIYDPIRRRMVIFGGYDDGPASYTIQPVRRDVWALSLGDTLAWTELHPGGESILPLYAGASAYDPGRDRMLVFGGLDSVGYFGEPHADTWVLQFGDSLFWTRLVTADLQPSARGHARAAFDPGRDRLAMYGGSGGNDTWTLSFAGGPAWSRMEPGDPGPPARRYLQSAVYDSMRSRVLMLGGKYTYYLAHGDYASIYFNDLWGLTFDPRPRWERVVRDSAPLARYGHSTVLDPVSDRLITFGGYVAEPAHSYVNELWQLPLSAVQPWSRLDTGGAAPAGRYLHTAVYDPPRRRMIVFGGRNYSTVFGDVWTLSLDGTPQWAPLEVLGWAPYPRYGHAAAYDPIGDRMIVYGGCGDSTCYYYGLCGDSTCYDDTWQLSLAGAPTWSPLASAVRPPMRRLASMAYDPRRQRIVLFGGEGAGPSDLNDTWVLPLGDTTGWMRVSITGATPGVRRGAPAVFLPDRDRLLVLQGTRNRCADGAYADAWMMTSVATAPALFILVSARAVPGGITLTWRAAVAPGFTATVQRRSASTPWADLELLRLDSEGGMRYEDRTASRGQRYAYRLAWREGTAIRATTETWVEMPWLPVELTGVMPNPATRSLTVSFRLSDEGSAARLEVLDVAGRRLLSRDVGNLGPGPHRIEIEGSDALRPGIYLVRLAQGREARVTRACVIR